MGRKNAASIVDITAKKVEAIFIQLEADIAREGLDPQADNKDECIRNNFAYMQEQRLEAVLQRTKFDDSLPKTHKRYKHFSARQEDVDPKRKADISSKLFEQNQNQENPVIGMPCDDYVGYPVGNGRRAAWIDAAAAGKLGNVHQNGLWMLYLTGKKYDGTMKLVEMGEYELLEHVHAIAGEGNRNLYHGRQPENNEDLATQLMNKWELKCEEEPKCHDWDEDQQKEWAHERLIEWRPDPYAGTTMAGARSTIVNMVFCEDIRQEHEPTKSDTELWGGFWANRPWSSDSEKELSTSSRRLYKKLAWSTSKHQTLRNFVLHCEEGVLTDEEILHGSGTDVNLLLSVGDKKRGKRISSATTLKTQRKSTLAEIDHHNTNMSYASGYFRKYPLIKRVLFEQQLRGCKPEAWEWNEQLNQWEPIAPVAAEA